MMITLVTTMVTKTDGGRKPLHFFVASLNANMPRARASISDQYVESLIAREHMLPKIYIHMQCACIHSQYSQNVNLLGEMAKRMAKGCLNPT